MPKSEAQGLPISLNDWIIIQSFFHNGGDCYQLANARKSNDHYRIWRLRRVILISLLNCLASDICSVEEAFCVLVVEFAVDNVLPVFDGICCGN